MQRISWTEKKTNESVRTEIGMEEDETLQQTAIRWTGKKNDAGTRIWKEEKRTTKEKMDGRDT